MLTCFNSKIKITQKFGNELYFLKGTKKLVSKGTSNSYAHYAQFNLLGHNGLDCVPIFKKDLRMFNFFKGKIIKLENHKAYGNRIVIWNKEKRLMEYHCHMSRLNNHLKTGQMIEARTLIGYMGNTGISTGPHNHIAFRETNEKGYIINLDNGYNGYIDPLKIIT
jgi:hypothetical protein